MCIRDSYKVTGCEGMGTNNVIRAVHSGESVSPLLVPAIFFGTVLTISRAAAARSRPTVWSMITA